MISFGACLLVHLGRQESRRTEGGWLLFGLERTPLDGGSTLGVELPVSDLNGVYPRVLEAALVLDGGVGRGEEDADDELVLTSWAVSLYPPSRLVGTRRTRSVRLE